MSQAPYTGPPSNSSGGGRTAILIVVIVIGVLLLGCGALCGLGIFGFRMAAQEATEALEQVVDQAGEAMMAVALQSEAIWRVQQSPAVKEKLGEPLTFGEVAAKSMQPKQPTTSLEFSVSGPMSSGTVLAEGVLQGDQWKISVLKVRLNDGTVIDIDPGSAPPLDPPPIDAPENPRPLSPDPPSIDEP